MREPLLGWQTPWLLFGVAISAIAAGMGVGFLYSTYGIEAETFSSFTTAINGAVAGLAVGDLARHDGLIRVFFRGVAASCGIPDSPQFVAVIALPFFVLGFLFMYVNKKLLLNILEARSDHQIAGIDQKRKVTNSIRISATEPGQLPTGTPDAAQAIAAVANSPDAGRDLSLDSVLSDVKAFFATGRLADAEKLLRRAIDLYPQNTDLLFFLASVLAASNLQADAIPVLQQLTSLTGYPIEAWKLLGYCYLWAKDKGPEAAAATETYLKIHPDDVGAKLNLIAALGKAGPNGPRRGDVLGLLRQLVLVPQIRQRLTELTIPGEDLSSWRDDPEFKNIINAKPDAA